LVESGLRRRFGVGAHTRGWALGVGLGDQLAILPDGAYGQAVTVGAASVRRELIDMPWLIDAQVKPPCPGSATAS